MKKKETAVIHRMSIRINDPRLDPSPGEIEAERERRQRDLEEAFFAEEPAGDVPPHECCDCGDPLTPEELLRYCQDPFATAELCDRCRLPADGPVGRSEFPEGSGG